MIAPKSSISVSGPDGAGKSTVLDAIQAAAEREGLRVRREWLRMSNRLSLPVLAIARLIGCSRRVRLPNGSIVSLHDFRRAPWLARLFTWTTLLDIRHAVRDVYRKAGTADLLLLDRFVQDTIVDLTLATGDDTFPDSPRAKQLLALIPEGHRSLLLTARLETLSARRPENAADARFGHRVALYDLWAPKWNMHRVENDGSIDAARQSVLKEAGFA